MRDEWDERDTRLDMAYHKPEVFFSPLIAYSTIGVPQGVGLNNWFAAGREIISPHLNKSALLQ